MNKKIIFGQKCILYNRETKKILILERSNYKQKQNLGEKGYFDMIGGSVEYGEDSKESIIREAKEETGIQLNNIEIVDLHSRLVNDDDMWFIFGLYFCDDFNFINNNEIELSHEHTNYKWINIDEIDNYKFRITIEYVRNKIIKKIKLENNKQLK